MRRKLPKKGGFCFVRHRVSRYSLVMNIYRSLQFSAVASRSTLCENKDTMNISVAVKNLNDNNDSIDTVISLLQMSLVSSKWMLSEKAVYSSGAFLKKEKNFFSKG